MFPISDSVKSKTFPLLTILVIVINVYIFFKEITFSSPEDFILSYALIPSTINFSSLNTLYPFLTSMFLHGGFLHIITNMWFLWIFGDNIEDHFGKIWFLLVYLVSGLAGNVLQYSIDPNSSIPMLGASGAVSGILGAYYFLFPHSKIKSVLLILFFITVVEIPAVFFLFYWFFLQLFSGITALSITTASQGGIAFWAHIGGFVTGILFAVALGKEKKNDIIEGEIVQ